MRTNVRVSGLTVTILGLAGGGVAMAAPGCPIGAAGSPTMGVE